MTSHREIMVAAATAVQQSQTVATYCREHFGRALEITVGAYAQGIPGEHDSPFLWIHAADAENEEIATDETFSVRMVVGGCVTGTDGEQRIEDVVVTRTETVNGLVVNGGNKVVEDLRDMIIGIVRDAKAGAYVSRIRRDENDLAHFPLEWATIYVDYEEPEAL